MFFVPKSGDVWGGQSRITLSANGFYSTFLLHKASVLDTGYTAACTFLEKRSGHERNMIGDRCVVLFGLRYVALELPLCESKLRSSIFLLMSIPVVQDEL